VFNQIIHRATKRITNTAAYLGPQKIRHSKVLIFSLEIHFWALYYFTMGRFSNLKAKLPAVLLFLSPLSYAQETMIGLPSGTETLSMNIYGTGCGAQQASIRKSQDGKLRLSTPYLAVSSGKLV
jgi:hypothetical protein